MIRLWRRCPVLVTGVDEMTTTNPGYAADVWRVLQAQALARAERDAGMALAVCDGYDSERGRYIEVQRPSLEWVLFWSER
jgi:hypothetical protein